MKKRVFRERYRKLYSDFKTLDKDELKEMKAEVKEVKPIYKKTKKRG